MGAKHHRRVHRDSEPVSLFGVSTFVWRLLHLESCDSLAGLLSTLVGVPTSRGSNVPCHGLPVLGLVPVKSSKEPHQCGRPEGEFHVDVRPSIYDELPLCKLPLFHDLGHVATPNSTTASATMKILLSETLEVEKKGPTRREPRNREKEFALFVFSAILPLQSKCVGFSP